MSYSNAVGESDAGVLYLLQGILDSLMAYFLYLDVLFANIGHLVYLSHNN